MSSHVTLNCRSKQFFSVICVTFVGIGISTVIGLGDTPSNKFSSYADCVDHLIDNRTAEAKNITSRAEVCTSDHPQTLENCIEAVNKKLIKISADDADYCWKNTAKNKKTNEQSNESTSTPPVTDESEQPVGESGFKNLFIGVYILQVLILVVSGAVLWKIDRFSFQWKERQEVNSVQDENITIHEDTSSLITEGEQTVLETQRTRGQEIVPTYERIHRD